MGNSQWKPEVEHPDDHDIISRYRLDIRPTQEKSIKIEKLYIYPFRGIMGIEVPEMKVSNLGIKYDREWGIYDKDKLGCIMQSPEVKLTQLRQRIEKNPATNEKTLIISVIENMRDQVPADLPVELRIPI